MSKLDKAPDLDLAKRAEELSREAERLRSDDTLSLEKIFTGTPKLDAAIDTSVAKLRKCAGH